MSKIILDTESTPTTPAAGQLILFPDNVGKRWTQKDDAGNLSTLQDLATGSAAAVAGAFAADTYLLGSSILLPRGQPKINTIYRLRFDMVKTAAGVAAFTTNIRYGINGNIADASILALAFAVGTAVVDTGMFELFAHFRSVGAAGVLAAMFRCTHHLAATGLITTGASGTGIILGASAGFNTAVNDSFIGVSINGGAAFAGTNTVVAAELVNA
jgi:hypothetical protein